MIEYNVSISSGYNISSNNTSCDDCRISNSSSDNSTQVYLQFAASRLAGAELSVPESPTISDYQQFPHAYHSSKGDGSRDSSGHRFVMSNSNGYNEIHTESQAILPPIYSNFNISDELFDYFNGFLEVATEEYQEHQRQLQTHHESHQTQQQYYSESTAFNFTSATPTISSFTTSDPVFLDFLEALPNDRVSLLSFLFLFSFATVFGNSLVILAVIRERYLHTATNYFITSLAVADCLVGLVVMPFSALYEVLENTWFFGTDWCDIWRSLDVLFSTASILNLCVISLDRYWAITDPFSYPMRMTVKRAAGLICAVWVCSSAISFPAIVWWRAARAGEMPAYKCTFTEHLGYLVFSSTISFYLPLLVMVFTYCRIYRAAVIQTRSLKIGTKQVLMSSGELQLTLRIHRGGTTREPSTSTHHHALQGGSGSGIGSGLSSQHHHHHAHRLSHHATSSSHHNHSLTGTASSTPEEPEEEPLSALHNNGLARHRHMGKNFSLSRKLAKFAKEKKAAKTLGIVMGVFIVCWLPFFVVNLLSGFCMECIEHEEVVSAVVTWLGWINSCMNPVIYACWSRDFRRAFLRLLCVCCPRKIRRKYQPAMRSRSQLSSCSSCSSSSNCGHSALQQPTLQLPARERNCTRCQSFHRHHHRQRRRSSGPQRTDFSSGDVGSSASHTMRTIQAIVNIMPAQMASSQSPTTSRSPSSAPQTTLNVTGANSPVRADAPDIGNIGCDVIETRAGASCSSLSSLQPTGSVTTTPSPTSALSSKQQQQQQNQQPPSKQQQHTRDNKHSVGKHCKFVLTPITIPIDRPRQASLFATTHYFKTNPQRRKTSFSSMNHHTPATTAGTISMKNINSATDDIVDYEQASKIAKSNIDDYCRVSSRDDDNDEGDDDIEIDEDENEEIDDVVEEASISSSTSSLNIQAV